MNTKLHMLAGFIVLVHIPCYALAETPRINVGATIGLNFETVGGDDANTPSFSATNQLGVIVGGVASMRINEIAAIQSEILYTTKGTSYEFNGEKFIWRRAGYLEFPLLVRGTMPLQKLTTLPIAQNIHPYIAIGPELSVLMRAELDGVEIEPRSVKNTTTTVDLGICMGVGMSAKLSWQGIVTVEGRYDYGLLSIDDSGEDKDLKNRVFSLMVGYQMPLNILSGSSHATTSPQ